MASRIAKIKDALVNNKSTKLVALVLAIIAWYAIREAISNVTEIQDVPVGIDVEPGWAILDRSFDSVDVSFRGSQEDIRYINLNRDQVEVEKNIGKPNASVITVRLEPKDVLAPGHARATFIAPNEITLSLDQEAQKQVPVKADFQGALPEGYDYEVAVTPAAVKLSGPRQRLEAVESVHTAPVDLEGRLRSFKRRVKVVPPSTAWQAEIEPDQATVEVTVVERSATKVFREIEVRVLVKANARPKLNLWPAKVNVALKGSQEALDRVTPLDIQAYVDCAALEPAAQYNLPVQVHAPAGVSAAKVEPATVKVEIGEL